MRVEADRDLGVDWDGDMGKEPAGGRGVEERSEAEETGLDEGSERGSTPLPHEEELCRPLWSRFLGLPSRWVFTPHPSSNRSENSHPTSLLAVAYLPNPNLYSNPNREASFGRGSPASNVERPSSAPGMTMLGSSRKRGPRSSWCPRRRRN